MTKFNRKKAYYNFQIDEDSGVPESMIAVPKSYMNIASEKAMYMQREIFLCYYIHICYNEKQDKHLPVHCRMNYSEGK